MEAVVASDGPATAVGNSGSTKELILSDPSAAASGSLDSGSLVKIRAMGLRAEC